MRTLRIDFTSENMLPDGEVCGRVGEHNATDLVITPPAEMSECGEIINYVAAFVTEGKIIRSDFYPKAEKITVSLCSQLTQDYNLGVQLEGYDATGGLVVKSPVIGELRLLPSAGGDETDFDGENGSIVSQINLNTLARHNHSNSSVLGSLGEKDGLLTFDGVPVSDGKIRTVELDINNDDAMIEVSNLVMNFVIFESESGDNTIPVGADVRKVEFKASGDSEWTDLRSIMKYDVTVPVFVQTFRAFAADGFIYFAQADFYSGSYNKFYDYATSYRIDRVRVSFTCDDEG